MKQFIHVLAVVTSIVDPVLGASALYAKQSPNHPSASVGDLYAQRYPTQYHPNTSGAALYPNDNPSAAASYVQHYAKPPNNGGSTYDPYAGSYAAVPYPPQAAPSLSTHGTVPNQQSHRSSYSSVGSYDSGLTDAMLDLTFGEYQVGFYYKDGQWYYGPYYQPGLTGLIMHGSMQPQPWYATPVGDFKWDPIRGVASGIKEADKLAANAWYSAWHWVPTSDYMTKMKLPNGHMKVPNLIAPLGQLSQGIASTTAHVGGDFINNIVNGGNEIRKVAAPVFSEQSTRAAIGGISTALENGGKILRGGAKLAEQVGKVLPSADQVGSCIGGVCKVATMIADLIK